MSFPGNVCRFAMLAFATAMLGLAAGCNTPERQFPRIINEAAPLPPQVLARFGTIGVLPISAATNVYFHAPPNRAEVFNRAAGRAFDSTYDHTEGGRGVEGFASKITASTIAAVTSGTLASIIKGVPPEEFERSQSALRKALAEESLSESIQREVIEAITSTRLPNARVLSDAAVANAKADNAVNSLAALASQGVQSVLEIHIVEVSFELKSGFNPDIAFSPQIVVQVRGVADNSVLYSRYFEYRGEQRKFTTWAANDARAFRAEVGLASREFARAILEHYMSPTDAPR